MNRLKTALVGCGYWGPNILRNLDLLSDVKVVVDLEENNFKQLKDKYQHVIFTTNLNEIDHHKIDAVAIVTPPNTHCDLIKRFGNYHLFVEKPLTHDLEEAGLALFYENKDRINCVGHVFLFSPEIRKLKSMLNDGLIKDVRAVNITRLNFGKYQKCGVEVDLLPHDISILRYLLGSELKVKKACYGEINDINVSGCAVVVSRDIECVISSSWTSTSKVRCVTITTKDGVFEYDMSLPNHIKYYTGRILEQNTPGVLNDIEVDYCEEPLLAELRYWLDLIKNPSQPNIISFKDGYEVVKVINDIKRVSDEGSF